MRIHAPSRRSHRVASFVASRPSSRRASRRVASRRRAHHFARHRVRRASRRRRHRRHRARRFKPPRTRARRVATTDRPTARQKMMGDFARNIRATTHERGKMKDTTVRPHPRPLSRRTRLITNLRIKPNPNGSLDFASRVARVSSSVLRVGARATTTPAALVAATRRRATRWCAPRARAPRD